MLTQKERIPKNDPSRPLAKFVNFEVSYFLFVTDKLTLICEAASF